MTENEFAQFHIDVFAAPGCEKQSYASFIQKQPVCGLTAPIVFESLTRLQSHLRHQKKLTNTLSKNRLPRSFQVASTSINYRSFYEMEELPVESCAPHVIGQLWKSNAKVNEEGGEEVSNDLEETGDDGQTVELDYQESVVPSRFSSPDSSHEGRNTPSLSECSSPLSSCSSSSLEYPPTPRPKTIDLPPISADEEPERWVSPTTIGRQSSLQPEEPVSAGIDPSYELLHPLADEWGSSIPVSAIPIASYTTYMSQLAGSGEERGPWSRDNALGLYLTPAALQLRQGRSGSRRSSAPSPSPSVIPKHGSREY